MVFKAELFLLLVAGAAASELTPLLDKLEKQVEPARAMKRMRQVYETDRWFTFPKFTETANYLKGEMTRAGLKNVEVIDAPADGQTRVGWWTMPMAWDAKAATLEIVEPDVSPSRRVLADYRRTPASLGMWSGPTPSGGVTADVVWLENDTAKGIAAADLKGKFLLTNRNAASVKWSLVKAGALGAINGFTENKDLLDGRQWVNAWGDHGWAFNKGNAPLLSFSVTPRQAAYLNDLLKQHGRVRVKAVADTRMYEGGYSYVTGVVKGSGDEEVLTLGHIAEQGAHDNATGVAAMLEALQTLEQLIQRNLLPRPRRTIRMLAMGELYGSSHYIQANPERIKRTVAAMCVDTPAATYDMKGTEYTFYLNPHSASSYVDAFTLELAREYFARRSRPWHAKPYMPGTDTFLSDAMIGIPTVWPYSGTGVHTHHNSADTPSTVDERSLRDLSVVNAAFLYFLASAGEKEARWLAELAAKRAEAEIGKARDEQHARYLADRARQAIVSVKRLSPAVNVNDLADRFNRWQPLTPPSSGSGLIVRRKRFGTIPLDDLAEEKREGFPSSAWSVTPTMALFWADGKRSIGEIKQLVEFELGPQKLDFEGYFKFLARHGYVELSESPSAFSVVEATIPEMQSALEQRRTTSREIVTQYLTRIATYEDKLNAAIAINPNALAEADALDRERAQGKVRGPLHGIPVALKDNIHTTNMPTTGGALVFDGFRPPYEATLTKNLREAGAIIIAKTGMTELANWIAGGMPNNYNALAGYGMNPYDPRKDPREATFDGRPALNTGGSSSGIGTAANFWAANVGTETSGSILSPANQNMLAAIKPTVGRISRYGIIPITADQDTAGPMAKSVTDAAVLLGVLESGTPDPNDPATQKCTPPANRDYSVFLKRDGLKGARIGIPRAFFYDKTTPPGAKSARGGLNPDQQRLMDEAIAILRQQGAVIVDPADFPSVVSQDPKENALFWSICAGAGGAKGKDQNCSYVLKYGMKRDFNAWLKTLGPTAPVKTLTELREYNLAHQLAGAIKYGQAQLDISDEMDLEQDRVRYEADLKKGIALAGAQGIDAVMKQHRLDAILFPGASGYAIAAIPGYPTVIVPFGTVPNSPMPAFPAEFNAKPSPYGVSFTGTACSEPRLIEIGYAFEQATKRRVPPPLDAGR